MPRKSKQEEIFEENMEIKDDFFALLESYKTSFVEAKIKLDQQKSIGREITLELLGDIFDERNLAKTGLLEYIEKSPEDKKSNYASQILEEYNNSEGNDKRALVDLKAYFINNGIC